MGMPFDCTGVKVLVEGDEKKGVVVSVALLVVGLLLWWAVAVIPRLLRIPVMAGLWAAIPDLSTLIDLDLIAAIVAGSFRV